MHVCTYIIVYDILLICIVWVADPPSGVKQQDTTVATKGELDKMDVGDKGISSSQLKKVCQDKQKKKLKRLKKKRLAKGRF